MTHLAAHGVGIGESALLLVSRARTERSSRRSPSWQPGIGVWNTIARMVRGDVVARGHVRPQGFFSDGRGARWWWVGLPMVPFQGYRLIRTIPRFSDADGVTGRIGSGACRMRVVALGDSVAAGYAIGHHRSSIAGQLAVRLADRYGATVDWQACARTGATAGEAMDLVSCEALVDATVVFVSIGVNDLKNLHTATRFRRELAALLDAILAAAPRAQVCLLGIPPLEHFPALPRPLADVLGCEAGPSTQSGSKQSKLARGPSGSRLPNRWGRRCSPTTDSIRARRYTPPSPRPSWRTWHSPPRVRTKGGENR